MRRHFLSLAAIAGAAIASTSGTGVSADVFDASRILAPQQQEFFLTLEGKGNKPRLGLPDFLVPPGDADLAAAARVLADVLWNDLDFEREFLMIPRKESAGIPAAPAEALAAQRWVDLGADAVLVGSASRSGDTLIVKVEMVSVRADSPGKRAFGAEYPNCRVQNPRFCAHSIADHVHKQRNLDGIARTKLAFSSDRDGARMAGRLSPNASIGKEIYLSDYDGANPFRMTVNRSLNISPAWSPTGGFLAYTSYSSNNSPDIFVANLTQPGRAPTRPAQGTIHIQNQMAAWSPDGTKLAFASNRAGPNRSDIWIVNRDGTDLRNLTNNTQGSVSYWAPTWSPDGNKIAFGSDRLGGKHLYVININGTVLDRLVGQEIDRPTWSPLNNYIAFTLATGAGYDIALYDLSTRALRVLTDGLGQNESPAVAPNGRHIAFVTTRWGRQEIATVNAAGGHIRRVTQVGNNTYPNWQPITPAP